jgi:hypothetical protein
MKYKGKYILVNSSTVKILFKCTTGILRTSRHQFNVKGLIYSYNGDKKYIGTETGINLRKDKSDWKVLTENEFRLELL